MTHSLPNAIINQKHKKQLKLKNASMKDYDHETALGNNVRRGERRKLNVYFISILLNRKTNRKTHTEQKKTLSPGVSEVFRKNKKGVCYQPS